MDDVIEFLDFVVTIATHFLFDNTHYRQKCGAAMGSSLSPIVSNLFTEDLEQSAIASAPADCAPDCGRATSTIYPRGSEQG